MDALTGFAVSDSMAALDSISFVLSLAVGAASLIFIAVCWFFIGRKAGVANSWLAFVPVLGHYVAWRASRTPGWTLAIVIVSSVLVPVSAYVLFASLIGTIFMALGGQPLGFAVPLIVASLFVFVVFGIANMAILTWWTYRVARELGFSWWTGLLASPIARLIPVGGQIVRLVFLGILAFRNDPL